MLWNFSKFSFFFLRTTHSDYDSIFLVKQIRPNKVAFQYLIPVVDKYTSHRCHTHVLLIIKLYFFFVVSGTLCVGVDFSGPAIKLNSMWIVLDRKDVSFESYVSSVV